MNYQKVTTLNDALSSLKNFGNSKILAGGTDLLVEHNRQPLAMDTTLVYIGDIDELKTIGKTGAMLEIGSLVTMAQLEQSSLVATQASALQMAAQESAGPQVRNRATIGGNIATASPAGDLVCALYALDAAVVIANAGGLTTKPIAEFITGVKSTALKPDELIAGVAIPLVSGPIGSAFSKLGNRKAMTISVANAACRVTLDGYIIRDIRLAAGSVAATVVRLPIVEQALSGQPADPQLVREKCELAKDSVNPITDQRATKWYRKEVLPVLLAQTIMQAVANAQNKEAFHD